MIKVSQGPVYLGKSAPLDIVAEKTYIPLSQKAAANGVATLDGNTLIPSAQLPVATTSTKGAVVMDEALNSASVNPVQNKEIFGRLSLIAPYIQKYEVSNFNNQTVVDASDLLAATGDLHALNLDLSANNNLTRLVAKGTSGNLANVSSVLVSNEAPFDNATSPQLDVSYTGLSRAALVNLFNSMPYNVGYTVVGSPTITDGIASGFSTTDYLQTSQAMSNPDYFEEVCTFTMPSSWTGTNTIKPLIVNTYHRGLDIYNPSGSIFYLHCFLRFTDNTEGGHWIASTALQPGHTYTGKLKRVDASSYVLELWENGSKIDYLDIAKDKKMLNDTAIRIGSNANNTMFEGTIDLNNTYIKENGVLWFRGTDAMTKTCSVVGCTGTPNLTADDKAICTSKGWALTVE